VGEETEFSSISGERISRSQRASDKRVCCRRCIEMSDRAIFYVWIVAWCAFVLLTMLAGITYSNPMMLPFFEAD
jgi:hypothetical protein